MSGPRYPWLLAAVVTSVVGVTEAVTVVRLIPDVTVVDAGALLFTGFLAGLFVGFYVIRPLTQSTDQRGRSS